MYIQKICVHMLIYELQYFARCFSGSRADLVQSMWKHGDLRLHTLQKVAVLFLRDIPVVL